MTEKDKCKAGELYNANFDKELLEERMICKELCFEYNNLRPSLLDKKNDLLKRLLGSYKNNFFIEQPFYCDYGYNIEIGENFYSNHNLIILDGAKVTIGDNVFIAPNCGIYTAGHPLDIKQRVEGLEYAYPITIGNNVWIGANVTILPGVTIGDNVTIGAGSTVTKDIPNNVLAFGNPAKIIKDIE